MTVQVVNAQIAGHKYAKVISEDCGVNITDDEFYEIARSVTFPIGEYRLPKNSDFYREIVNEIVPEMNRVHYRLAKIIIRGGTSPDGPLRTNIKLANKRQQAIYNLVNKTMILPSCDGCISVMEVPCDYGYLLRMMKKANDKDYETVKAIVDKYADDVATLREHLALVSNGRLWTRLWNKYFDELRYARVVLLFKKELRYTYIDKVSGFGVSSFKMQDLRLTTQISQLKTHNSKLKTPKIKDLEKESKPSTFNVQPSTHIHFPVLAVKTNLLYDGFYTPKTGFEPIPNVELEYYFHNGAFSILAEYEFPWWRHEEREEFFQMQNWQLEPRFYFKHDHYFNGFYVGAYANFNRFDFALKGNNGSGVQGEGAGAGLSVGYVVPLGKKSSRFKLEFNVKAGYYETRYDPYDYEYSVEKGEGKYYYRWWDSPTAFRRRNWRYRWMGPTGAGITFSYDLFRRKVK